MPQLPDDVRRTRTISAVRPDNIPTRLRGPYWTRPDVWSVISVSEGSVRLVRYSGHAGRQHDTIEVLGEGDSGVMEPSETHRVSFARDGSFSVSYYRRPRLQDD